MADFLDEIEEDLKQEKLDKIIKKFLPYVISVIIICILSVSIYVWNKNNNSDAQKMLGLDFYQASTFSDTKALDLYNKIHKDNKHNYSALAGLQSASILINEKKIDEALKIYKEIYNSSFDILFKDLAQILYISYSYNKNEDQTTNLAILSDLAKEKRPWRYNALQLKTSILLDHENFNDSQVILLQLSTDKNVPETIAKNAKILLSMNWKKNAKK